MASSVIALRAPHSAAGPGAPLRIRQLPRSAAKCFVGGWSSRARIAKPLAAFNPEGLPKRSASAGKHHKPSVETRVAAPVRPVTVPEQGEDGEEGGDNGDFDFGRPPPFTLAELRAAIPKHCFQKSAWRSTGYVARDVAAVFALAAGAAYVNHWAVWPLYWFAQGTMFWALFVLGHDCGHGSFSNSRALNNVVGHLTHSSILVPYHGWRISHRTHHQNHGHVENDESWYPLTETVYRGSFWSNFGRLTLPFALVAYPFYLWGRSPGKSGSHFDPSCDLFVPSEKTEVLTSAACYGAMAALLVGLGAAFGPLWLVKLYVVPYVLNLVWLDVVTYLHHHGHNEKVPWFRGAQWSYLRGGLSTMDRDYGIFNNIQHDIGTHVVHHLFPQIPHYNLIEATEAAKPVLGRYYREPDRSPGPFPAHLIPALVKSFREDRFVKDEGDVVYYQNDAQQR